jgi:hypothetical protein
MAYDDEIIYLQERFEGVGDDADLEEVYGAERHLLCMPALEHDAVGLSPRPMSEILDDLKHLYKRPR